MRQGKRKLLVIVGPTGSGKSALAVKLAKELNGEIVSADSRQIYRGLEIGSNYPSKGELRSVPHHLIGIADPRRIFTVAEYQKLAKGAVEKIWGRNKLPILVGGTGFYIRAVVDGIVIPEVPPNEILRAGLEKKTAEELANILKKKDKKRWRAIDRENKRRLIRAIEIAETLGSVPKIKTDPIKAEMLMIGLNPPKESLEMLIRKRAERMVQQGLVNEAKKLLKNGVKEERMRELGFEYHSALKYIQGKIKSQKALIDLMTRDTMHYVKRQMTWFKKDKRITWFDSAHDIRYY